jgi:hypothetical protein
MAGTGMSTPTTQLISLGHQRRDTMPTDPSAYGLWSLVILNTAVFIIFACSVTHPHSACDWRSFGAFAAFLVALCTEMYGFPLTLYLLAGGLGRRYPRLDLFSHDAGHLWNIILGWRGDPHLYPLHILSSLLIGGGFILFAASWPVLYAAQRQHTLVVTGPSAHIHHLQAEPSKFEAEQFPKQTDHAGISTTCGRGFPPQIIQVLLAVCRVYPHHARLSATMADAHHPADVPRPGDHVRLVGPT